MAIPTRIRQYVGRRLARRLSRSIPWIGGLVALAAVGAAVRRKGWIAGSADTALDMIPFVGAAKNLAEVIRGRDFIQDKRISG